jgi:hypothetical protein
MEAEEVKEHRNRLSTMSSENNAIIDMGDLDIEDGPSMSFITGWLQKLLRNGVMVELIGAPQMLVHNLYRVGYHPHPGLNVRAMRQDEPTA